MEEERPMTAGLTLLNKISSDPARAFSEGTTRFADLAVLLRLTTWHAGGKRLCAGRVFT